MSPNSARRSPDSATLLTVTTRITYDMLEDLLFEDLEAEDLTREEHLERSKTAEEWATAPGFELEDEELRAELLVEASREAAFGGDDVHGLDLARQAVDVAERVGDRLVPDVRIRLYEALRSAARDDEARELEASLRRDLPQDLESFAEMGSILAEAGESATAQRWFTMGIRFAEQNDLTDEFEYDMLLLDRADVRARAGLPKDEYDLQADDVMDELEENL
jgi:hypothetical protein